MVAYETMRKIGARKLGTDHLMALKLDINKVYDRVEWDFSKKNDG